MTLHTTDSGGKENRRQAGAACFQPGNAHMTQGTDLNMQLDQLMPLIRQKLSDGQTVRFSPMGISMKPMLRQKKDSVVLSAPPPVLKKYDLPLYRRDDGKYILHRVVKTGETYTCCGDNLTADEPGIRPDQILALVTVFYRGNKKYSVRSPGYRLYCILWHHTRPLRRVYRGIRRRIRQHFSV